MLFRTIGTSILLPLLLTGCGCGSLPLRVTPIQRGDKKLDCKQVLLEINESEHYRKQAYAAVKKAPTKIWAPSCMIFGVSDGLAAASAADARIEYLGNIYDLLECGGAPGAPPPGGPSGFPSFGEEGQPRQPSPYPPAQEQERQGAPPPPAAPEEQGTPPQGPRRRPETGGNPAGQNAAGAPEAPLPPQEAYPPGYGGQEAVPPYARRPYP
jgi:hypothetical protein